MSEPYEAERMLAEYLLFHYGSADEVLPWGEGPQAALDFPLRCVEQGPDWTVGKGRQLQVLDLGCAVGRIGFEVARRGHHYLGVDASHRFIEAANTLRKQGEYRIEIQVEGRRQVEFVARAPVVDSSLLRFETGDAHNLPAAIGTFDVVFACNLLCRLRQPLKLLRRLASLVKPGGQLLLTTPYSWLESYTEVEDWLGGESGNSFDAIVAELSGDFTLQSERDMPFLIREHARKYQWNVAHATLWRRTSALGSIKVCPNTAG